MDRVAQRLLDNRITIQDECDKSIELQQLCKEKVVFLYKCHNLIVTIENTINKVFLTNCSNITLNINKLYAGIELVYCDNIHLNIVYSPIIQIDLSNTITINSNSIIEMFVVYCMTHTILFNYYTNNRLYSNEMWDDVFSRQIVTHINPETPNTFNTREI